MAGRLNRLPYPDDKMSVADVFHVKKEGNHLLLTAPAPGVMCMPENTPSAAGETLSLQPNGVWETRKGSVDGAYERFKQNGQVLVFNPGDPYGHDARGFVYWEVPNED